MSDLAKRLHAIQDKWRWMPGMLVEQTGGRVLTVDKDGTGRYEDVVRVPKSVTYRFRTPELTDPATKGCLIHQIRKVTGQENWIPMRKNNGWWVIPDYPNDDHDTEEEAILVALEAL